jgi:hypothetical protein
MSPHFGRLSEPSSVCGVKRLHALFNTHSERCVMHLSAPSDCSSGSEHNETLTAETSKSLGARYDGGHLTSYFFDEMLTKKVR